jgi:hypothetical protein
MTAEFLSLSDVKGNEKGMTYLNFWMSAVLPLDDQLSSTMLD